MHNSTLTIFLLLLVQSCTTQADLVESKEIDSLSNFLNLDTCNLLDLAKMEEDKVIMDSIMVEEKGTCDCYYAEYWEDKLHQTGFVLNGKASGKWVEYDSNGEPMMITTMENDKRNGEFLSYRDGHLVLRCYYKDDRYHGKWERWDYEGNVIEEVIYDNGMIVDQNIKKHWEPNGVKVYLFEVDWYNKENDVNLKPGAYIWHEGELMLLKKWTLEEIEDSKANMELIKKAQETFYENLKKAK